MTGVASAERCIVEHVEILGHRAPRSFGRQAFLSRHRTLAVNIGADQAGIDREAFGSHQTFAMQRSTVISNSLRSRSLSRNRPCRFFEKVE